MTLLPGCSLVVAPSFQPGVDWRERILLGAGIDGGERGFVARPPWRPPDERELKLLVSAAEKDPRDCFRLFGLPRHLQARWWALLERARTAGKTNLEGLDDFVAAVADFLSFKELPVPEGAVFDVVVSQPGLFASHQFGPSIWGGINLGEEATSLVFLNQSPGEAPTLGAQYPPVRLRIEPGEGFRFPASGMLVHGCTLDQQGPAVLLLVR